MTRHRAPAPDATAAATAAADRTDLRGERGFTLIELMIGMLLSAIIVVFVFAASGKMATAYQTQNQITDVQDTLRSVSALIAGDLRQAGFLTSDGFRTAAWGTPTTVVPALSIDNNAGGIGPDSINIYYADASASGRVVSMDSANRQYADVEHPDGFAAGDMAVLVNGQVEKDSSSGAVIGVAYTSCVVKVTAIDSGDPARFHFTSDGGLNTSDNSQCTEVSTILSGGGSSSTAIYRFVGRSYRIDPSRRDDGVLQGSLTGGLVANDWTDLAVGVSNLQFATRYYEPNSTGADPDGDGDDTHNWYSADNQETTDPTGTRTAGAIPDEVSVSLESRTTSLVNGITSATSAPLSDSAHPDNNSLGDWPAVQLAGVADADRPDGYTGDHVYRWNTVSIELRNMGATR